MATKTQTETCSVCWNDYNKSTRKKISCNFCDLECCRECIRTYLLQTTETPHCMECKNKWELDFTKKQFYRAILIKLTGNIVKIFYLSLKKQEFLKLFLWQRKQKR